MSKRNLLLPSAQSIPAHTNTATVSFLLSPHTLSTLTERSWSFLFLASIETFLVWLASFLFFCELQQRKIFFSLPFTWTIKPKDLISTANEVISTIDHLQPKQATINTQPTTTNNHRTEPAISANATRHLQRKHQTHTVCSSRPDEVEISVPHHSLWTS